MLFDTFELKNLRLHNRLVRSATCDWMADPDGFVTEDNLKLYKDLSAGKIGLIVSGHMFVTKQGHASPGMFGISSDDHVPGLKKLADTVHESGPSKIAAQINHGGRNASYNFGKCEIAAPSAIASSEKAPIPRAFETEEIYELAEAYGDAAVRVQDAGFDAVQIHSAHGYLGSQFLSPLANKREDEFGGTLENRARFLLLVLEKMRAKTGEDYPILIKIGSYDGTEGGLTLEEGAQIAKMLEAGGIDSIEVSGGIGAGNSERGVKAGENEAQFLEQTRAFRKAVSVPIISVNAYRSLEVMEKVLTDGDADLIALCRPFIREPDLAAKLESGEVTAAACISCNGCFKAKDGKLVCRPKEKEDRT